MPSCELRDAALNVLEAWAGGLVETPESTRMRALLAALRKEQDMSSFSSTVRVTDVRGEDFGLVAVVTPAGQPGSGIDVTLAEPALLHVTEDAADAFREGAELTLTLEARP